MRHHRRQWQVLTLVLVLGLVGHLWMLSGHDMAGTGGHVAASSAHHGGHDQAPSGGHAAVCSALPSIDHRAAQPARCPAIAPAVRPWAGDEQRSVTEERRHGLQRRSPRSPDHGVVLVL